MHAQLTEASRLKVDIVAWTDHDWRMQAVGYWNEVSFGSATDDKDGRQWRWTVEDREQAAQGRHTFGTCPDIAGQEAATDCLYLVCDPREDARGEYRLIAHADRQAYRTSLHGQRLEVDVFPEQISDNAALTFDVLTSYRPATNGRPAGRYRLSYRIGGEGRVDSPEVRGGVGIITVDAPAGEWTRVAFEPATDLTALWPDIDGRDASSFELSVAAVVTKSDVAAGYFRSLTIDRVDVEGDEPVLTQAALMELYRGEFPAITQISGTEISLDSPHLGALSDSLSIPVTPGNSAAIVEGVKDGGGIVSYNHPFGSGKEKLTATDREKLVSETAARLVDERALGCNMIEAGYRSRGGGDLEDHQTLWDSCSRAGVFLTGVGTNDNHTGADWDQPANNFVTWIWAPDPTPAAIIASLASGHVFFGDPNLFAGTLDLRTPSGGRMGQVIVADDPGSVLSVLATGLPEGANVEVVKLAMLAAGDTEALVPREQDYERTLLAPSDFSSNVAEIPLESGTTGFYRAVVVDAYDQTIALSNPIWLLDKEPTSGIPSARQARS
ncbi:MAG: hypothetical protein WBG36_14215 [Ornithinimicrobium sp.]